MNPTARQLEKLKSWVALPEKDFMNAELFPLSTQGNLDYEAQKMINSFVMGESARRIVEEGAGADLDALQRIREIEIKFGASFIEVLLSLIEKALRPPSLFLSHACKKCEGPAARWDGYCFKCNT